MVAHSRMIVLKEFDMEITESKNILTTQPTQTALFLRNFLPWQIIRFIIINIRMSFMIIKSHGHKIQPKKSETSKPQHVYIPH